MALLDRRLSLNNFAPFRTVESTGFEPVAVGKGCDLDFSNDTGGALSLNECCLAPGDRISMKHDFGDASFIFKIIKLDVNQQGLPEITVVSRACVDQTEGASVVRQFGQ